jgi:C4-dicarboxylate-specific signal transduction histidine kinase
MGLVGDLLDQGDSLADPALRDTLYTATGRLRDLLELLDRVLRPARPSEPEPIALRQVVEHVSAIHATHPIPIDLDAGAALAARLPAVRGAEDALTHALLNLLLNAHEALAGGAGHTIRLAAETGASGQTVALVMDDDGPGVAAAVQDRLFQPFVTTKQGHPLAGLGLAVARELLEQFGGTVRWDGGSRFRVELEVWRR